MVEKVEVLVKIGIRVEVVEVEPLLEVCILLNLCLIH